MTIIIQISDTGDASPGVAADEFETRPALCVDLDGTVRFNKDDPAKHINGPDDIAIFPDTYEVLQHYRNEGYLIFAVSNQGGVAYGHKTPASVEKEMERTNELCNGVFHALYACYQMPGGSVPPYNHRSLLRKPQVGMLALLEAEAFENGFVVDWDNSIMVGDREDDRKLAENAQIYFAWADKFFNRESQEKE